MSGTSKLVSIPLKSYSISKKLLHCYTQTFKDLLQNIVYPKQKGHTPQLIELKGPRLGLFFQTKKIEDGNVTNVPLRTPINEPSVLLASLCSYVDS